MIISIVFQEYGDGPPHVPVAVTTDECAMFRAGMRVEDLIDPDGIVRCVLRIEVPDGTVEALFSQPHPVKGTVLP